MKLDIPDESFEKIMKYLGIIKERGQVGPEPKKIPEQLEPYLIQKGEAKGVKGTTYYKGKLVPKSAAVIAEKRKKR